MLSQETPHIGCQLILILLTSLHKTDVCNYPQIHVQEHSRVEFSLCASCSAARNLLKHSCTAGRVISSLAKRRRKMTWWFPIDLHFSTITHWSISIQAFVFKGDRDAAEHILGWAKDSFCVMLSTLWFGVTKARIIMAQI